MNLAYVLHNCPPVLCKHKMAAARTKGTSHVHTCSSSTYTAWLCQGWELGVSQGLGTLALMNILNPINQHGVLKWFQKHNIKAFYYYYYFFFFLSICTVSYTIWYKVSFRLKTGFIISLQNGYWKYYGAAAKNTHSANIKSVLFTTHRFLKR